MKADSAKRLAQARKLDQGGQKAEALEAYRQVLSAEPACADAWADLGGLLVDLGRHQEAIEACGKALALDRSLLCAVFNLGCAQMKMGQPQEAEGLFRRILAKDPHQISARLALAECLIRQENLEEALANLEKVLQQEPENMMAFRNAIHASGRRGDWEGVGTAIQRRLKTVPGCPQATMELGMLHLLLGEMPRGWDEYEARFQAPAGKVTVAGPFPQPFWDGRPFPGKTLLLCWEQGFGDTLMFIRYASLAKARGGRVLVLAKPALADLIGTCPGVDQAIPYGNPLPPFDFHLPLMSLPRIFKTDLGSIPGEVPYLGLPERIPNREWIAQVLATSEGRVRIGYAWAGRSTFTNDQQRSIPPELLAPLGALPGVAWHSFQVPAIEPAPLPSVSLGPILSNFSDTAYALSGMDLVITVDTALAHAAGALGIPTFLMLAFDPDWRWLLGRSDSPWYPTLRIYRQPRAGDWGAVIQQILKDLGDDQDGTVAHG